MSYYNFENKTDLPRLVANIDDAIKKHAHELEPRASLRIVMHQVTQYKLWGKLDLFGKYSETLYGIKILIDNDMPIDKIEMYSLVEDRF